MSSKLEDVELDEETRKRMRQLMKEIADDNWRNWHNWIQLGCILFAIGMIGLLVMWLNRADYQRRLDMTALEMVKTIRVQTNLLEEHLNVIDQQNRQSIEDRKLLHDENQKSVQERKKLHEELKKLKRE